MSNEVVAQTKETGKLWVVAVSAGEGRDRTVVTRAGMVAVTVERGARIEVGHRSRGGVSGSKWCWTEMSWRLAVVSWRA